MDQGMDRPVCERRLYTFAMRMNQKERQLLEALAAYLQRSRSDVVRLLVREAARLEGISADQDGNEGAKEDRDGL